MRFRRGKAMTVPSGMPTLAPGHHSERSGKACVMEYVSVLAGEEWSDSPRCTNPTVAAVARCVNDSMKEDDRPLLVPLIGRLLEAHVESYSREMALAQQLVLWQAVNRDQESFMSRLQSWGMQSPFGRGGAEGIALLVEILDEYDRLTGRVVKPEPVPDERLSRAVEVVAGVRARV